MILFLENKFNNMAAHCLAKMSVSATKLIMYDKQGLVFHRQELNYCGLVTPYGGRDKISLKIIFLFKNLLKSPRGQWVKLLVPVLNAEKLYNINTYVSSQSVNKRTKVYSIYICNICKLHSIQRNL